MGNPQSQSQVNSIYSSYLVGTNISSGAAAASNETAPVANETIPVANDTVPANDSMPTGGRRLLFWSGPWFN